MATASEIADLITQGLRGPVGPEDSGWHVGKILSWSASTGLNSVYVNGATLTNLKALTPSIGTEYAPGQDVLIVRKQTQYVILGPVTTPGSAGSTPPTQIDGPGGVLSPAAGANVWRDLDGGAALSPSFTVKIAPFQRCMILWGCKDVKSWGCEVNMSLTVTSPSGVNRLATPNAVNGQVATMSNQISISNFVRVPLFKTFITKAAAADGDPGSDLGPGNCAVAIKYKVLAEPGAAGAGTATSSVQTPWLLAVPF